MANDVIGRIKAAADCAALFKRFWGTHWRERGNCVCPWHTDSPERPSLSVEREKVHCFAEGKSWDAIDLYQEGTGCTKAEAIKALALEFGITPAERSKRTSNPDTDPAARLRRDWKAFSGCEISQEALSYLTEERKLGPSIEALKKKRCIGYDKRAGAVAFPVTDWQESTLFGIQVCPLGGGEKRFRKGSKTDKGILRISNGGDHLVVCEGVFDAMAVYDACSRELFLDSVSLYSASGWRKVGDLPGNPVLFFDADWAGYHAACRCLKAFWAKAALIDYELIDGRGKDPNDLLKAGRGDLILQAVKTARRPADEAEAARWIENILSRMRTILEAMPDGEAAEKEKLSRDLDAFSREMRRDASDKSAAGDSIPKAIEKSDGAYWRVEYDRFGTPNRVKIANFTVDILRNFSAPTGMSRLVRVTHENGKFAIETEIEPMVMAARNLFSAWALSQGNFLFRGSQQDLERIWELELESNDGRVVYRPDHIGWIQRGSIWLFGDCAVDRGAVHRPDDEGIIWIGDAGYQAITIESGHGDGRRKSISADLPTLRWDLSETAITEARLQMVRLLKKNLGGFEAYLALGFIAACAYSEELFREFRLPILFIFGRRQCGKNTLASLIMAHFGLGEDSADNITSITKAALARKLAYYSSIPVWVDEYRSGDADCQKKESLLRSAYDRVGGSKGTIGPGVISPKVRAPLIVTGESFPSDSALTSRCAMVQLSEMRRSAIYYDEIRKIIPVLSGIFFQMIKDKSTERIRRLIETVRETKTYFEADGMDPRLAGIYAVLGEAFIEVYNPEDVNSDQEEFGEWLKIEAHKIRTEKEEKLLINEFFADMEVLKARKQLNGNSVQIHGHIVDGGYELDEVCLWLKEVYNIWSEDRKRRGESAWSLGDVQKYLREEPYFVRDGATRKINKVDRKCFVLRGTNMPRELQNIFMAWRETEEE